MSILNKAFLTCLLACGMSMASAEALQQETLQIDANSFSCIRDLTPVRGFFVDNLTGDVEATVKAAQAKTGAVYPVGSVVQLVPTEAMIKRADGYNAATKNWEFFELDVSAEGTKIGKRGFTEVVNKFGGNCFGCHAQARPEWDMICEQDHGCDPIPVTPLMVKAIQKLDPRCEPVELTTDEAAAMKALAAATTGSE